MGIAPVQLEERAKTERETANPGVRHRSATKSGLAARYGVGIRTIENWQYAGIIRAGFEQGHAVFDVADCDEQLLRYRR
jgi:hypothetical protein